MVSLSKFSLITSATLICAVSANPFKGLLPSFIDATSEKPVPGDSPVAICDTEETQILELTSLVISPNPPVKGENLTVSGVGFLSADVTEGAYVEVDVRYGYIKLLHQTFDLCEEMGEVDLECPLEKGVHQITKSVEIPAEVPPGKYVVYARAYTKDDEFIACITASVEFPYQAFGLF